MREKVKGLRLLHQLGLVALRPSWDAEGCKVMANTSTRWRTLND
jgi:hypothetical protein